MISGNGRIGWSMRRTFACLARMVGLGVVISGMGWSREGVAADRWEAEIRALESRVAARRPAEGSVVLYGSSSFRIWTNAAAAFPGKTVVNLGFGGSTFADLSTYCERLVVPLGPRVVLLYGGDNDLAAGKSPAQVEADFEDLVKRLRRSLPRARVGVLAIKPSPSRAKWREAQEETNAWLKRYAARHRRVDYVDVASPLLGVGGQPDGRFFKADQLHLNAAGYGAWQPVLAGYVDKVLR